MSIIADIDKARHVYAQENRRNPVEIVMDVDTADRLRIETNRMLAKGDRMDKAEKMFGGRIFGMLVKRWPRNEKGFAVR